jgi:hypothetical protein
MCGLTTMHVMSLSRVSCGVPILTADALPVIRMVTHGTDASEAVWRGLGALWLLMVDQLCSSGITVVLAPAAPPFFSRFSFFYSLLSSPAPTHLVRFRVHMAVCRAYFCIHRHGEWRRCKYLHNTPPPGSAIASKSSQVPFFLLFSSITCNNLELTFLAHFDRLRVY